MTCADGNNCLVTTATTSCPIVDLKLEGLTSEAEDALTGDLATYTDGYKATVTLKYGSTFHTANMGTGSDHQFVVAMGRNGETAACTATECSQGYFSLMGTFTNTGSSTLLESHW